MHPIHKCQLSICKTCPIPRQHFHLRFPLALPCSLPLFSAPLSVATSLHHHRHEQSSHDQPAPPTPAVPSMSPRPPSLGGLAPAPAAQAAPLRPLVVRAPLLSRAPRPARHSRRLALPGARRGETRVLEDPATPGKGDGRPCECRGVRRGDRGCGPHDGETCH